MLVGSHDILFVTLDTLRFDVAVEQLAAGRTPTLARVLPGCSDDDAPAVFKTRASAGPGRK